jgi:hypothetical protein
MKRPWSQTLSTLLPRSLIRELKLSDADVFAGLSESECDAEAYVQTPYGTLLDSTTLEQESGDARTWHHLNVAAFIFHAVSVNRTVARWLGMESEDFNINLSTRLWANEVQVTNPLRPESVKYLAFQFTFCQVPEHVRRKRAGIQQPRREREAPWPAGLSFEQVSLVSLLFWGQRSLQGRDVAFTLHSLLLWLIAFVSGEVHRPFGQHFRHMERARKAAAKRTAKAKAKAKKSSAIKKAKRA